MKKILRYCKFFIIFSTFSSFVLFFLALYVLWKYSPELPSYEDLKNYNPSLTTRVFTSDGKLLDEYYIEERIFVPIEKMPKNLIYAFDIYLDIVFCQKDEREHSNFFIILNRKCNSMIKFTDADILIANVIIIIALNQASIRTIN